MITLVNLHIVITIFTGVCGAVCLIKFVINKTITTTSLLLSATVAIIYYVILYNFAISEEYAHFWISYALANIFGFLVGMYDEYKEQHILKL